MDNFFDLSIISLLFGIIVPLLLYWLSTRNHKYWARKGIPYVKTYPLIGSIPGPFTKVGFEESELQRYRTLGRIYGHFEGSKPGLTIGKPELIRDFMVKDFVYFTDRRVFDSGDAILDKMLTVVSGEDWKRIRTIVSPTFSTGKIKRVMSIFEDSTKTLIQNFKMASNKGESIDVLKTYGAFAMDVIASSAFSTKIDSHNDPDNEFVKHAREAFSQTLGLRVIIFIVMPKLFKLLGIKAFKIETMQFFKNVTLQIIEERKKTGQKRNDFLQLLVDSATEVEKEEKWEDQSDDIAANYGDDSRNHSVFKNVTSKRMSMNELVAQCVIFFLAGYHTTATSLSLATYLLALNQDVQEKAFKEIKDVLAETNGEFKYETVQKLKYLDNVISETLRMYPPVIRLERSANSDYKFKDTDLEIKKGTVVGIPVLAMHHDPELFPDPEKFNPDRFCPEEKEKQVPYTYLPFGAGPRNCVGMRFALMEMKVCLVYVLSAFQFKKCDKTLIPLQFEQNTGLMRPKSIILDLIERSDCPLKPA